MNKIVKADFDSGIRRFDPSRPSQCNWPFIGFYRPRHIGQTRTDGTHRTHKSRHSPSPRIRASIGGV